MVDLGSQLAEGAWRNGSFHWASDRPRKRCGGWWLGTRLTLLHDALQDRSVRLLENLVGGTRSDE